MRQTQDPHFSVCFFLAKQEVQQKAFEEIGASRMGQIGILLVLSIHMHVECVPVTLVKSYPIISFLSFFLHFHLANPLGMLIVNLLSPTIAPEAKDIPLLVNDHNISLRIQHNVICSWEATYTTADVFKKLAGCLFYRLGCLQRLLSLAASCPPSVFAVVFPQLHRQQVPII